VTPLESDYEKTIDLLAEQATHGLDPADCVELDRLLLKYPDLNDDSFELAAAALTVGGISPSALLPQHLRERLLSVAEERFPAPTRDARPPQSPPTGQVYALPALKTWRVRLQNAGWYAAAATLFLGFFLGWQVFPKDANPVSASGAPKSPSEMRLRLLSEVSDTIKVSWTGTGDLAGKPVRGDVVWSSSKQSGFLRFEGLPMNARELEVYQLWIFDANQDARYPIDGGLFDIAEKAGEVIVPITAKLHVQNPTMFAVTLEKPGGVVVSKRERLLLTARVLATHESPRSEVSALFPSSVFFPLAAR
jgi:hypothetical protein